MTTCLKHTKPCKECPWRREAPPGWLGGYSVDDFVNQIQFDGPPLPCHMTISEDKEASAMCAGALIYMKNTVKGAFHPGYGDALQRVEKDVKNVFQCASEFRHHHTSDDARLEWAERARLNEGSQP